MKMMDSDWTWTSVEGTMAGVILRNANSSTGDAKADAGSR